MPWVALPHKDERIKALSSRCGVRGIPTLVIVDTKTGKIVNDAARGAVDNDPEGNDFPWAAEAPGGEEPFRPMAKGSSAVNTAPCLIIWTPTESDHAAVEEVAVEVFKEQQENQSDTGINFFHCADDDDFGKFLKGKLGSLVDTDPVLTILDVPGGMKFYTSEVARGKLDAKTVREFVDNHTAEKLTGKSIQ